MGSEAGDDNEDDWEDVELVADERSDTKRRKRKRSRSSSSECKARHVGSLLNLAVFLWQ